MTTTRSASRRALWICLACVVALAAAMAIARWLWQLPAVAGFVQRYPGLSNGSSFEGTPAWVGALHALNIFFFAHILRSGLVIRWLRRPVGHWKPRRGRLKEPVTIEQWWHVVLDLAWLGCGLIYLVLLLVSGRWVRLIPTDWDIFPNAASVALQYLAFHWPENDSWVSYNALQMLCYFVVVFVLAPGAAITGLRMSFLWPQKQGGPFAWFTIDRARKVHVAVMVCFIVFVVVHVTLVASTGFVASVSHIFAARHVESPLGVIVLIAVLAGTGLSLALLRPVILRSLAGLTGRVTR